MKLVSLFRRCLTAKYSHTEEDGDYCVQREGDTLYILFQWTHSAKDWINNFNFPATPYQDMGVSWKCHRGFLKVWKAIKPYIEQDIKDPTVKQIYVVGYSHGAAIATLCHEYVWFNRPDLRESGLEGYGFGCPRCYWGFRVKKELRERWKHFHPVRNCNDIVTHVPPLLFGFVHVNNILILKNKELKYRHKKNMKCIDSHYPDNYLYSLTLEDQSSDL